MQIKEDVKYTKSHEWIKQEGNVAAIGITDYAQDSLGDIVYVEIPETGMELSKGDEAVSIESVKVAEAVYAPVSGKVVEANEELEENPELINKDAFGTFIYKIEMSDSSELDELMDADSYKEFVESQEH